MPNAVHRLQLILSVMVMGEGGKRGDVDGGQCETVHISHDTINVLRVP